MKTNIGVLDQVIRIAVGLVLVVLFAMDYVGPWGLLGIVLIGTGLLRFCPLYRLFGIHSCAHPSRLP
jgi:hypothetical protein